MGRHTHFVVAMDNNHYEDKRSNKAILGICTRKQFIMSCVAVGLVVLLIVIVVPVVILTQSSSGKWIFNYTESYYTFYDCEHQHQSINQSIRYQTC